MRRANQRFRKPDLLTVLIAIVGLGMLVTVSVQVKAVDVPFGQIRDIYSSAPQDSKP